MNEEHFRALPRDKGYADAGIKEHPPDTDGPMFVHDLPVLPLTLDGEFSLARRHRSTTNRPSGICELEAGIELVERTGTGGARIVMGNR